MIVCPACSQHNPEGAQLCRSCGASLAGFIYRACPACGSLNGVDRVFCRRCLSHLIEPSEEDLEHGRALAEAIARAPEPRPPASDAPPVQGAHASSAPAAPRAEPNALLPGAWLGDLQELTDLLPLATTTAQPQRTAPAAISAPDPVERQDAALFQRIATQPAPTGETSRAAAQSPEATPSRAVRALLAGLVLLAALAPWATQGRLAAREAEPAAALPELAGLAASDTVWVVIDYTPAYADELVVLSVAVLDALGKGPARVVLLTTQPAGKGLAAQALRAVWPAGAPPAWDERFTWLGYLPATEASLQALRARQSPPARIVLLSESDAGARLWVEQIATPAGIPLEAWVSARAAPMLVPYQRSGQLARLVAGPADPQAPDQRTAALVLDGLAAYAAVLVIAAALGLVMGSGRRRAASQAARSDAP